MLSFNMGIPADSAVYSANCYVKCMPRMIHDWNLFSLWDVTAKILRQSLYAV